MSNAGHKYTDEQIDELVKEFEGIYQRASDELEKKASDYFARFEKQDEQMRMNVDKGLMKPEEYEKWRIDKMMTGEHWKMLKEQSARTLLDANKNALKLVNGKLPSIYSFNYNEVGKDAENVIKGYSFDLVNERAIAVLAKSNKTLLPYNVIDERRDERWNTKKVNAEVMQGIIQGESIPKIAKRLSSVTEMNIVSAIRNARTAMTGAENRGTLDGMIALEEDGVILEKTWLASHDKRVRDSHAAIDGESVPVKEEFGNGLMYPGDPDGDDAEVYNCRCSIVTDIVGFRKLLSPTIGSLKEPERPRKSDYDTEEAYEHAKYVYRERIASYNENIDRIAEETLSGSVFENSDELVKWAKDNGITVSKSVLDDVDIKVFNSVKPALEELFERFPEIKGYESEYFDGSKIKFVFNIGNAGIDDSGVLLSANGGLNFNLSLFGKENGAFDGVRESLDSIGFGYIVRGDGSFATLVRHEYGHNVQSYIETMLADKYHQNVDDWRKNFSSFSEFQKAREKYLDERHKYDSELLSLAGKSGSSDYSNANALELFAEGFAEYTSGGTSEFGQAFGEFLERWYK